MPGGARVEVLAGSVSSEASVPGLRMAASHCALAGSPLGPGATGMLISPCKDVSRLGPGPPIGPRFTLVCSVKALSPTTVAFSGTGGRGFSTTCGLTPSVSPASCLIPSGPQAQRFSFSS